MSEGVELRGKREMLKQEARSKELTLNALRKEMRSGLSVDKDVAEIKWDDLARVSINAAKIGGELYVLQTKLNRIAETLGRD